MEVNEEVLISLQKQIQELRGQVESLEYFRDQHMGTDIGQSGFNYPHPNQKVYVAEYGGGKLRLDKSGIQIVPTGTYGTALRFVPSFQSDFPTTTLPLFGSVVSGFASDSRGQLFTGATDNMGGNGMSYADNHAFMTYDAQSGSVEIQHFLKESGGTGVSAYWNVLASGVGLLDLSDFILQLARRTADHGTPADGHVWYRSDIDTIRVHANSITRNLTMDGTNTTLTIATGAVTATTSFHAIDTEAAGATDDLDTISGGQTGQVLYIHAANGARDVVAKDGTGNLKLASDFTMNNTEDMLTLIFDGTNWLELARSDNGA